MSQLILEGTRDYCLSYRAQVVQLLADLRREWQKMAPGKSLIEVESPIGLVLSDIADRLELNPQERYAMLGGRLINQVNSIMEERVRVISSS
ncbi:MAG: hypothetical protein WCC12_01805 [Anaerolineales bacterium]